MPYLISQWSLFLQCSFDKNYFQVILIKKTNMKYLKASRTNIEILDNIRSGFILTSNFFTKIPQVFCKQV